MKKTLGISLILLSLQAHAAENQRVGITCDAPWGSRVDYFENNKVNQANKTFLMARDKITGIHPKLILDDQEKSVYFELTDTTLFDKKSESVKSANMNVIAYNDEQITFTGVLNNAPVMGTFYPKMNILIFSQQSIWKNEQLQGANAFLLQSQCTVNPK